jgi:hypothetical protein
MLVVRLVGAWVGETQVIEDTHRFIHVFYLFLAEATITGVRLVVYLWTWRRSVDQDARPFDPFTLQIKTRSKLLIIWTL